MTNFVIYTDLNRRDLFMKEEKMELTQEQIEKWKEEFGAIYRTTISGIPYIWRKLRRIDYVDVMSRKKEEKSQDARVYARQDEITKRCVLYPENIAELVEQNGALSTVISDEIMLRSGFAAEETEEL